jgi:hypothetical protein
MTKALEPESSLVPKRKTTHALPVSILDRLRIYAAALGKDQQDVVAMVLDQHLPQNPFTDAGKIAS